MISVLDSVKELYKNDSTTKKYFLVFRDATQKRVDENNVLHYDRIMLDNSKLTNESLSITESICSSGNFKVGLCESATAKINANLPDNVNGDEICIFQTLGDFTPEISSDDTKGLQISEQDTVELTSTFTSSNIISGLDTDNFDKEKNYLILAKFKYLGKPIYLYVETPGGTSRMVYYLKPNLFNLGNLEAWDSTKTYIENEIVLHNNFIWESLTYNNTVEPGSLVNGEPTNAWENITHYVQVAIPIIGSEFYEYKLGVYPNDEEEYGTLEGSATIYELPVPIMPLGLFTINRCKRKDDSSIRALEGFDRMQDVGLDVDVYLSGSSSVQLGEVLNQAASETQIVIGSNLSKDPVTPILVKEEILVKRNNVDTWMEASEVTENDVTTMPDFPTGTVYKVIKNETKRVQGFYSTQSSNTCETNLPRTQQKTLTGTYQNGGNYSHTQMQIINGTLVENVTAKQAEFSTTIYATLYGTYITSDDSSWTSKRSAGKIRVAGSWTDTWSRTRYRLYRYPESDGTHVWGSPEPQSWSRWTPKSSPPSGYSLDSDTNDYRDWYRWDDYEDWYDYDSDIAGKEVETQVYKKTTYYGYYYEKYSSIWGNADINNLGLTGYYTKIGKSNGKYVAEYVNVQNTLYWKYNWEALAAKTTTKDSNWNAYGSGTTFQYASTSSGTTAKYPLSSTRGSSGNWYKNPNVIYSANAVYTKMSRKYTRTHYFDYTFGSAGSGWAVYKNASADSYNNYVKDAGSSNILYMQTDFASQYSVGTYSNVNVYKTLAKDYRCTINYGYDFREAPTELGWSHPNPDYTTSSDNYLTRAGNTVDGVTELSDIYNTCWRDYERAVEYTWTENAVLRRMTYAIQSIEDGGTFTPDMAYTVYITYPKDTIAYIKENDVRELALQQIESYTSEDGLYSSVGNVSDMVDNQSLVQTSMLNNCTKVAEVSQGIYTLDGVQHTGGIFYVDWVQTLSYNGTVKYGEDAPVQDYGLSGTILSANPFKNCEAHSTAEKFNDMQVIWGSETIHGKRRDIIAGFLELHGMFINFDRWGVSTIRNVKSSTLYPAENIFPHDMLEPGLSQYGNIYPSVGSNEIAPTSICKSIYIDDDINTDFQGVLISKSQVTPTEASVFPFYYNRLSKRYGALPRTMPEIAHEPWVGNNYYVIENNFFIDNFIFGETAQEMTDNLKKICQQILSTIGDLQYFNMTAEIRCLPYMEVGDNINIMTPKNGYETAVLRRTMKGNMAQMDSIETDFYT